VMIRIMVIGVIMVILIAMVAVAWEYAAAQQDGRRDGEEKEQDALLHNNTIERWSGAQVPSCAAIL
jgi:hypothetical protein